MGAGASLSLCQTASSVRVLKHSTRVEPEARSQEPDPGAVFGVPLSRLREAGKLQHGVPLVLRNMVQFLEMYGLRQSGVFRVCGSAPRCRMLRVHMDRGECVNLERGDVPTVAALLKLYLRELPCGLIPNTYSQRMQQALIDSKDRTELSEVLKETLTRLPHDNYNVLSYLLHFLSRVAAHSRWNHMTTENLATVFGPCIFRVPEGPRMLEEQTVCNTLTLHLLEKHSHLIPNTYTHTLALAAPPLADVTGVIREEQSCTKGTICDTSVEETKDMNAHLLTTPLTQPPFNSGVDKDTEAKKEERKSPKQTSCLLVEAQSCFIPSDMSPSLLQRASDPPSPNNNNNAQSHTHTDAHSNHTHSESRHTHSPNTAHIKTVSPSKPRTAHSYSSQSSHTHSRSSHSRSESSHSHSEISISHTQSNRTHSESSHTYSESSHAPSISGHTHASDITRIQTVSPPILRTTHSHSAQSSHSQSHTVHTHTEEEPRPATSYQQSSHTSRIPTRKAVSAHPSPHYLSQNQHFSSEADSASSSQTHIMSDCISSADGSSEMSVSQLQHHIRTLKQTIRSVDDSFQHNLNNKGGRSDEMTDPEVTSLKMDLCKARKQLKELRSRQDVNGLQTSCSSSTGQQGVSPLLTTPTLEDTVKTLTQHLKEKRLELNLPDHVQDMSQAQLALEKTALQKSLLYYERLHGRPRSREERSAMRELYDRYRSVKQAFYTSNKHTNTSGKDAEVCIQQSLHSMFAVPTQEDSNPAFISRPEEKKQPTDPTHATQAVDRAELQRQLKATREEKRRLRKILKEYEETGRSAENEDRTAMVVEYDRYKTLKARLQLLKRMLGQTHSRKAAR